MSIIPCSKNEELRRLIDVYVEALKVEAHRIGKHGLSEEEFYNSGLFRGAIERTRGRFAATMREKREFARLILDHMKHRGLIASWESAGESNRHDYVVQLNSGRVAAIELKGCLDGNNTNIFTRPSNANEFIIWSVCTNAASDPRLNAWSGIHTRLSAEIISTQQVVDGLVVWDMVCGTIGRPCPKLLENPDRATALAKLQLPPPCIYLLPSTVPNTRNNPKPSAQKIDNVHFLHALNECFGGNENELNFVDFEIEHKGVETVRKTRVRRDGLVVKESPFTAIQRE